MHRWVPIILISFASLPHTVIAENKEYEFRFQPWAGYSNWSGVVLSLDAGMAYSLGRRWQWTFGGSYMARTKRSGEFELMTGAQFNLSEDRARSIFVGIGAGWGNRFGCWIDDCGNERFFGYAEVGKRWQLNDSGTWSYSPSITGFMNEDHAAIAINPLQFSYSF